MSQRNKASFKNRLCTLSLMVQHPGRKVECLAFEYIRFKADATGTASVRTVKRSHIFPHSLCPFNSGIHGINLVNQNLSLCTGKIRCLAHISSGVFAAGSKRGLKNINVTATHGNSAEAEVYTEQEMKDILDRMNHSEKALSYFMEGYNCSQATAAAFAEDFNLQKEAIFKMMAGFGGGIGGRRETCGAVSGMVYVAGLLAGNYPPEDRTSKKALYDLVKKITYKFEEKFGTTSCKELLLRASCEPKPDPSERNATYYAKRPCARFVEYAAEIIDQEILSINSK